MNLEVSRKRARLVVQRVTHAFSHKEGILADHSDLVENQVPEGVEPLSRNHAQFLFFTVFNDHGMRSSRLYTRAKKLFVEHPELFQPSHVLTTFDGEKDRALLDTITRPLGVRYPSQAAKAWYSNSRRLQSLFEGDARNLYHCSNDAESLLKEITVFRGYGSKTGGMLLRAIVGLGFAKVKGLDRVLVPVDIHDSRIAFLTGVLSLKDDDEQASVDYHSHIRQVQEILLETCNDLGISWLNTDRALWLIGSRGCVSRHCVACPLQDLCIVGRGVIGHGQMSFRFDIFPGQVSGDEDHEGGAIPHTPGV